MALIKPLPIWVLQPLLLIEHHINVNLMSKGSGSQLESLLHFLAGRFPFSPPTGIVRNPFKKRKESDFSPVPLGLSFEIQLGPWPAQPASPASCPRWSQR